jgi:diguanylate cyclase (GGDEF)-like protein
VHSRVDAAPARGRLISNQHRNGNDPKPSVQRDPDAQAAIVDAQRASDADQTAADADQTAADADQTAADADQTAAASDQTSADSDQDASDRDQATADRDHDADQNVSGGDQHDYEKSRHEREAASSERFGQRLARASSARTRDETAGDRDRVADARDEAGRARDARAAGLPRASAEPKTALIKELEEVRAQAGADRGRAAADRARAASDRAKAARDRARLEAELRSAHLDELTGAYRREMGRLALSHEIDRARRSDGRFVLAFVDVDRLKEVNDRLGHAAGDRVLETVVRAIKAHVRSFDPIIRYGGDEFLCGMAATDLAEAKRRFEAIGAAIKADAQVAISVGLAELAPNDTADQLTERADAAMLAIKGTHHAMT